MLTWALLREVSADMRNQSAPVNPGIAMSVSAVSSDIPRKAPESDYEACPPSGKFRTSVDRLALKAAMIEDLKEWAALGNSRDLLAERLAEMAGRQITVWMIESWVAEGKDNTIPADLVDDWQDAIGSDRLSDLLERPRRRCIRDLGEAYLLRVQAEDRLRRAIERLQEAS